MKYPFIFFGSPRFAEIIFGELLRRGFIPDAVVCNPDRPVGRKKIITPPPVKILALENGIPVLQPGETENPDDFSSLVKKHIHEESFGVVAAYARIIPLPVLSLFPFGVLGVHPSLLPLYRGATPIQTAILNGETITGVSIYKMDERMDHGGILGRIEVPVLDSDRYVSLEEKLALAGSGLLTEMIPAYIGGGIVPLEQEHEKATYTKKIRTEDGFVDIGKDDPLLVFRKIRALSPDPGVYAFIGSKRTKLLTAVIESGKVIVTKIVEEGKNPMDVRMEI